MSEPEPLTREQLERMSRTRPEYDIRCAQCGAPHWFDCSLPSKVWNQIAEPHEMLCLLCIDERLAAKGLQCDEAEFYFVGRALKSKLYGESHGAIAALERDLEAAEKRAEAAERERDALKADAELGAGLQEVCRRHYGIIEINDCTLQMDEACLALQTIDHRGNMEITVLGTGESLHAAVADALKATKGEGK